MGLERGHEKNVIQKEKNIGFNGGSPKMTFGIIQVAYHNTICDTGGGRTKKFL